MIPWQKLLKREISLFSERLTVQWLPLPSILRGKSVRIFYKKKKLTNSCLFHFIFRQYCKADLTRAGAQEGVPNAWM